MFKRRSSKDLSVKIGYDNVNGKSSRNSATAAAAAARTAAAASVAAPAAAAAAAANVNPLAKRGSSSSSFSESSNPPRKSTGTLSPESGVASAEEAGTDTNSSSTNSRGPSPLTAIKSVPLVQPLQQQHAAAANGADTTSTTTAAASTNKTKTSSSAPKVMPEPPSKSLVIGEGVLFEGTTEGCAAAVVGGKLVGNVKSRRLEVTRAGRVEGVAVVETAEIAGIFEGNLVATKALKVCSTGRVKGDVSFGSIVVENGGKLEGKVNFEGMRASKPQGGADSKSPPSSSSSSSTSAAPPTAAAASYSRKPAAAAGSAAAAAAAAPPVVAAPVASVSSTPSPPLSPVAKLPSVSSAVAKLQPGGISRASPE